MTKLLALVGKDWLWVFVYNINKYFVQTRKAKQQKLYFYHSNSPKISRLKLTSCLDLLVGSLILDCDGVNK